VGCAPHTPYPTGENMCQGALLRAGQPYVEVLVGIVDEVEERLAEGGDLLVGC
jgi:hypothetical protein